MCRRSEGENAERALYLRELDLYYILSWGDIYMHVGTVIIDWLVMLEMNSVASPHSHNSSTTYILLEYARSICKMNKHSSIC